MSVNEFAKSKGFVQIASSVRKNTNGYPFVTFINKENVAENVYFSKRASGAVTENAPVTKDMLKALQVALVKNEAGEERIKLISNSERLELSALLD